LEPWPCIVLREPPTFAIVLLCGVVGVIDVHIRRERVFWANLGVTVGLQFATFASVAVLLELLLAIVR
jgi:hypothetical protein